MYTVLDAVRFEFTPSVGAFEFTDELQKILFQKACYVKTDKIEYSFRNVFFTNNLSTAAFRKTDL